MNGAPATPHRFGVPKGFRLITPTPADDKSVTDLTRRVVKASAAPLAIDEIVSRVLRAYPEASKPEIYSAAYKAAKRDEFFKDDQNRYSYNHDYRRGGGGDQ